MSILLVGVGNALRGDDDAGLAVVRGMRGNVPDDVTVLELQGDMTDLIDHLQNYDVAIIVDATRSGSVPGTVHRFDVSSAPVPEQHGGLTTHGISVGSAVELARRQGRFPRKVVVFGIEGSRFEQGAEMSPDVRRAIHSMSSLIHDEIDGDIGASPSSSPSI